MRRILNSLSLLTVLLLFTCLQYATAQNPNNALLYSNQATLFGDFGAPNDPVSIVMPGTAFAGGFGSFLDNPASAALHAQSFTEFGLSYRMVDENAQFLGNSRDLDDNQINLSNAGFVYSFPTRQGSFVIGAGYSQHSVYNRALGFRGRNENSTITDKFKLDGSPYQEIAFNTFATDFGDEFDDWDESILRLGFDQFGDYLGIRQQGEIFQRGYSGEYSVFLATEFQQNFMVGASVGLLSGRMNYSRIFQEVDEFNDYDGDFIDSGSGFTDIDNILLDDRLNVRFTGLRARVGVLYRLSENVSFGASYTLPTRINVDEEFDAEIITTFNNGLSFDDSEAFDFSYSVTYPSRVGLGLSLGNGEESRFSASFATEYVNYSRTEIDFNDSALFEDQLAENEAIEETFQAAWNFRSGLAYRVSPDVTLRAGYSYIPSRFKDGSDNRNILAFGTGILLTPTIRFEAAAQYTMWEEVSSVYDYAEYNYTTLPDNPPSVTIRSEEARRDVDRWNVMGTIRFSMN